MNGQEIITFFNLTKHPEGGYYKETYRSKGEISSENLGNEFDGNRNYCTSIYFLLTSNNWSFYQQQILS